MAYVVIKCVIPVLAVLTIWKRLSRLADVILSDKKKSDIEEFDPFYIRGLLREGFVRIVEGRGRLGGYFFKCLQTSVLGGFAGIQRDRVARFLIEGCCNNDASGCVGTSRQAQNVEQVQIILEAECVFFGFMRAFL